MEGDEGVPADAVVLGEALAEAGGGVFCVEGVVGAVVVDEQDAGVGEQLGAVAAEDGAAGDAVDPGPVAGPVAAGPEEEEEEAEAEGEGGEGVAGGA